jgi:archaellum component FlaC
MAWSGEITPELIGDMVKVLNKLPDYIRKLDRKRIASEKSLEARKNKIQHLEDEIKRLVTKSLHLLTK